MLRLAEQRGKDRFRIETRQAEPVDRAVARDQRGGVGVADDPVILDRSAHRPSWRPGAPRRTTGSAGRRPFSGPIPCGPAPRPGAPSRWSGFARWRRAHRHRRPARRRYGAARQGLAASARIARPAPFACPRPSVHSLVDLVYNALRRREVRVSERHRVVPRALRHRRLRAETGRAGTAVKAACPTRAPFPTVRSNERTVHLCIDMQRLFAEETPWHTPWMERVLPVVARIAEAHPEQTIFTRFIPPRHPDEMRGTWRRFYRRWAELTLERIDPGAARAGSAAGAARPARDHDRQAGLFAVQRAGDLAGAAASGRPTRS